MFGLGFGEIFLIVAPSVAGYLLVLYIARLVHKLFSAIREQDTMYTPPHV